MGIFWSENGGTISQQREAALRAEVQHKRDKAQKAKRDAAKNAKPDRKSGRAKTGKYAAPKKKGWLW